MIDIASIVPAPVTPYEMVARYEANQASLLMIAIVGILLLAFAYWPRKPTPVYVSLDEEAKPEPPPRPRTQWRKVDPEELGPEFWGMVDDVLDAFMVVDITDEMDEEAEEE